MTHTQRQQDRQGNIIRDKRKTEETEGDKKPGPQLTFSS